MTTALVIKPNGTTEEFEMPSLEDELELLQKLVSGYIEPIELPNLGYTMYVNEEGKIEGLPYNKVATAIWAGEYSSQNGNPHPIALNDFVVGSAVVIGLGVDSEGNSLGLTKEQVEELNLKIPPLRESLSDAIFINVAKLGKSND